MGTRRSDTFRCSLWGLFGVMVALVALSSSPAAGQSTVASIIGRVTDQSGAVLPGVTVTATSPALLAGQMTTVTNEVGEYRLAPLPIGVYEIVYELSGFQSARRGDIRLTVGFTARADAQLPVGALAETLTVSGTPPVVDVTAASPSTLLTNEVLQLSPTSRNSVMSVLELAPAVRSFLDVGGGQQMLESPLVRAYGSGGKTWYTLEGLQNFRIHTAFWDFQAFDEVAVQTIGADAEQPTKGVQINALVKSGGNVFHGGGFWAGTNIHFQGSNLDSELEEKGVTSGDALENQYDLSGELGGRIVRNKLWFYSAVRRRHAAYDVLNNFQPDGSPGQTINDQRIFTNKISYQVTSSNKFTFMNMWEHGDETKGLSELVGWETREYKTNDRPHTKIEWEGLKGNSLIASLQLGHARMAGDSPFLNDPPLIGRSDLDTEYVWGDNVVAGESQPTRAFHYKGSVTWYKPNWASGNHEIKGGFDYGDFAGPGQAMKSKKYNYHLQYASGVPDRVAFFNAPTTSGRVIHILGLYVKDNWTIGRRLTLNLGLRYGHESAFVPAACREAATPPSDVIFPAQCFDRAELPVWNFLVPRLQAAYDLLGDGKTVVKGSFGRFGHMRGAPARWDKNTIRYAVFQWRDLNGNDDWDVGESNRDPNGPDFIEFTGNEFGSVPPKFAVNPDEKQVFFDEYSVSFERELMANFSLRATGVYNRANDVLGNLNRFVPYEAYNVPVTKQDPGADGRLGTADDGGLFTYYEFSPALLGAQFVEYMPVTWPGSKADQSYKTIELASIKRLSNRWQLVASYSATKKNIPIGAFGAARGTGFGTGIATLGLEGDSAGFVTPNNEINTSDMTWEWDAKLLGAYVFPADILVSGNFHHTSGDPFARQVRFTGGRTIPSIVLNVEPIGTYRRPNVNLLTVRVEKRFALPRAQTATVTFNVYNFLNANTVTAMQGRSGASFLHPLAIMPPRLAEVSLAYKF